MSNGKWNKVESQPPIKFEKDGDSIEGTVKKISKGDYDNNVYEIETNEGTKRVFGTKMLDRLCNSAGVKEGDTVKFVFKGMIRAKAGFMKVFEVYTQKS